MIASKSAIDPRLIRAYRETHYVVNDREPFALLIDKPSPQLVSCHRRNGTDCSAFITACNPFSRDVGAEANESLHNELGRELDRRSLVRIDGLGVDPSGQWPGEQSYLVFGLTLESAQALGRVLKQNAIVWAGADALPRLVLLR